jgi:hypothetical protein
MIKKEKIVIFNVEDVCPVENHGLKMDESNLQFIKKLNKQFGLKATLFVPYNYHNKHPLNENKDWVQWLSKLTTFGHDIAAHGYSHITTKEGDEREFYAYDEKITNNALKSIKFNFENLGIKVSGIRFPEFGETRFTELFVWQYFDYNSTDIIGERIIKGFGGIKKVPYNLSIDRLYDIGHDVYIINSNVSKDLNLENYLKLVSFLSHLHSKYNIKYMTYKEYIELKK